MKLRLFALLALALIALIHPTQIAWAQAPVGSGTVLTIAGWGGSGFSGDGGLATNATLFNPAGLAIGADGTLYIADHDNYRIRAVNPTNGIITTFAGNGFPTNGCSDGPGDGGPATNASFCGVIFLAADRARNALYFGTHDHNRLRTVNLATGIITNYAGTGGFGYTGDGGPALTAEFFSLGGGFATDEAGNLAIADVFNSRIRQINPVTGIITLIAGNGDTVFAGDGGPATSASFEFPVALAADRAGNVFVNDEGPNSRIRRIDFATGLISTVAGGGTNAPGNGPATNMNLNLGPGAPPYSYHYLAVDDAGSLYIANNHQVLKVDLATGLMSNFAGASNAGPSSSGIPALDARFNEINGLAVTPGGGLLISDRLHQQVRYVAPATIILTNDSQRTAFHLPWVNSLTGDFTVSGNSNLTTVNAGSLTNVNGSVSVDDNISATGIDLGFLNTVGGSVSIDDNVSATGIDLISLYSVGGSVSIDDNVSATGIDLGFLNTVGGSVGVDDNVSATGIDLSALDSVGGSISIDDNISATGVDLGSLTNVGNSVSVDGNTSATGIDMSFLNTAGGSVSVDDNVSATGIDLGSLEFVGASISVNDNISATGVDLGSLTNVGGSVNMNGNTSATNIQISSLTSAGGNVVISGNDSATTIDLDSLASAGESINISGNDSATTIDLSSLGSVGGEVNISGNDLAITIDLGSLALAGENVNISGNDSATTIDVGSLDSVGGDVNISGNDFVTTIDLGSLTNVNGDVTITSNAPNVIVNLSRLRHFGAGTNSTIALQGGTFIVTNSLTITSNATLAGAGTLAGTITNAGKLAPGRSPGRFDITGNLVLTGSSELRLELGGYTFGSQFDFLSVAGNVTLSGSLAVRLINHFASVMTNGASFTLLTAGSPLAGAFANVASGGLLTTTDGYARFTVLYAGQTSLQLTGLVIVDSDGDRLPDWWEDQFSLSKTNSADAALDPDGDGAVNAHEFLAGTNPTNAASVFRVVAVQQESDSVRLIWNTVGGKSYRVQTNGSASDLFADFSPLIAVPGAGDSTTNIVAPGAATNAATGYYRVRLGP